MSGAAVEYHDCPVCGYDRLHDAPRPPHGGGSFEICPSCGFQFGVSDDDEGWTFEAWREEWTQKGCPWSSVGIGQPADWNPQRQLQKVRKKA